MRDTGQISGMTSCFGVLKRVVWRRARMAEESNVGRRVILDRKKKKKYIYIYKVTYKLRCRSIRN